MVLLKEKKKETIYYLDKEYARREWLDHENILFGERICEKRMTLSWDFPSCNIKWKKNPIQETKDEGEPRGFRVPLNFNWLDRESYFSKLN